MNREPIARGAVAPPRVALEYAVMAALALVASTAAGGCGDDDKHVPATVLTEHVTPEEKEGVRKAFVDYRTAVLTKNGERAADTVTESTLTYFEEMRVAALSMNEAELRKKPVVDRFMIVTIRTRRTAAELRAVTGRTLFAQLVKDGTVGKDVRSLEPADVEVRGDEARLGVKVKAGTLPPGAGFRVARERGVWKLDVMSTAAVGASAYEEALKKVDPDVDKAIVKVLEMESGTTVPATIWQPLDQAAAPAPSASAVPSAAAAPSASAASSASAAPSVSAPR